MKLSQFKFKLPEDKIALHPTKYRDESRLMVLHRNTGKIEHKMFKEVLEYFDDKDVFIFNDTKVFPARLYGNKEKTGARIEVFLLRELNEELRLWDVLVDPARKIRIGNKLYFGPDDSMVAEVIDNTTSRGRTLRFLYDGPHDEFKKALYELGETPLPHTIINRPVEPEDAERFQSIFAKNEGAVTAPTASLHFSRELMKRLEIKGVDFAYITLHAGLGNFRDIDVEDLTKHKMDSEQMFVDEAAVKTVNRAKDNGKSNSGEGGEALERLTIGKDGLNRSSAIKQVASGRFGVTSRYLTSAKEIQIKMAQGAKPGEGGHLPAGKVYPWIAKTRHSTPGVALISPPPHHDIYSIEDLAQLIYDLKNANDQARISVKLVSEAGVGTVAAGVAKAGAQVILVSGDDGGTGAAPRNSIHDAGLPWELGVAETHQSLIMNGLRDRVILETDGKLMNGHDVVVAALLGAEEYGFATAPLVTMGCVMMRVCNLDTCPVGVATQNPELRKNFRGKPEYVINFMRFVAQEMREYMAKLGVRTVDELIGRTDLLYQRKDFANKRANEVDLHRILNNPYSDASVAGYYHKNVYDFELEKTLDKSVLIKKLMPSVKSSHAKTLDIHVGNVNRAFGTQLGAEITRLHPDGLPEDTITVHAQGSGGQSFGAFIPKGLTMTLEGDSNDYFGKGLSGGKLVVFPPKKAAFKPDENIIIGNVALYGATSGKAFIEGVAGERFAVRNSGAIAVVEGVGDHGCEYMTGGRVAILGPTGKNFAAGMSGGIAYVLDEHNDLYTRLNKSLISIEELTNKYDVQELKEMITEHAKTTGSAKGKYILEHFSEYLPKFKKIIPNDYKRMLNAIVQMEEKGLSSEQAQIEAFYANAGRK